MRRSRAQPGYRNSLVEAVAEAEGGDDESLALELTQMRYSCAQPGYGMSLLQGVVARTDGGDDEFLALGITQMLLALVQMRHFRAQRGYRIGLVSAIGEVDRGGHKAFLLMRTQESEHGCKRLNKFWGELPAVADLTISGLHQAAQQSVFGEGVDSLHQIP